MSEHADQSPCECLMCSQGMDSFLQTMQEHIQRVGWSVQGVLSDEQGPGWSYTIGLQNMGWPELLVVGLAPETGMIILNTAVLRYKERGAVPKVGDVLTEVGNLPLMLGTISTEHTVEMGAQAVYYAEREGKPAPTMLQVIIPDRAGKFPDEPEFDHAYMDKLLPCLTATGQWDFRRKENMN